MNATELLKHRAVRQVTELVETLAKLEHSEVERRAKEFPKSSMADSWDELDDIRAARDHAVECEDVIKNCVAA